MDRPLCKCHNEPMVCPSHWRCATARRKHYLAHAAALREYRRRHYEAHTEQTLEYNRRYNDEHSVQLNFKRYFRRLGQGITSGEQRLAGLEQQIDLLSRIISVKEDAS